jgi:hypothetical protein
MAGDKKHLYLEQRIYIYDHRVYTYGKNRVVLLRLSMPEVGSAFIIHY